MSKNNKRTNIRTHSPYGIYNSKHIDHTNSKDDNLEDKVEFGHDFDDHQLNNLPNITKIRRFIEEE